MTGSELRILGRAGASLLLGADLDTGGVDDEYDRGGVRRSGQPAPDRARTFAIGACTQLGGAGVISWKVRHNVESEGTKPNSDGSARRCSVSLQASPRR